MIYGAKRNERRLSGAAPLAYSCVFLVVASLAIGLPAAAHGPSGHATFRD
jgi:hypothetical protein